MGHRQVVELLDHAGSRRHPMLVKLSQQVLAPRPSTVTGFQHHTAVVLGTVVIRPAYLRARSAS
jgi:hypothetical protein